MTAVDGIGSMFLRQVLKRMKQLGLNQSALAKRMNVSRPYITKVLRSDVNISFGTAPLIATPAGQPTAGGYAKLARALEMDFFPELREKVGVDKTGLTENVTAKG